MNDYAIRIENLSKKYQMYNRNIIDRFISTFIPLNQKRPKDFCALNNINIKVKKGEILGILGRNGAGKSTLLKLISGISEPTTGIIQRKGKVVPLLELGGGFNPEYTGKENIYFYCSLQGLKKKDIDKIYHKVLDFSELGEFINIPIKKYSSGMKARLAFSVSINIDPDILILDEVLSVGDELFKRKCFSKMEEFFKSGKTILFVSHNLQSIRDICTRAIVINNGEIIMDGEPDIISPRYRQLLSETNKAIPNRNIAQSRTKYDINIYNVKLYDFDNNILSILKDSIAYKISFEVNFNQDVENVSFGVTIYNTLGKNIIGAYYPNQYSEFKKIEKSSKFQLEFTFDNLLLPGLYFARVVVRGNINNIIEPLSVVQDAISFKVVNENNTLNHVTEINAFKSVKMESF